MDDVFVETARRRAAMLKAGIPDLTPRVLSNQLLSLIADLEETGTVTRDQTIAAAKLVLETLEAMRPSLDPEKGDPSAA